MASKALDGSDSEFDSSNEDSKDAKGKGKGAKEKKTRSSKACDNCRKSKCKCLRVAVPGETVPGPCENCKQVKAECTFQGQTRKRGPPKGYIEAIESRLHRMEALLGGLLQNDDPRASILLDELIGDDSAREILTRDLREAAAAMPASKPRKSWKKGTPLPSAPAPPPPHSSGPTISHGFSSATAFNDVQPLPSATPRWFTEDELAFAAPSTQDATASSSNGGMHPGSFTLPENSLGFDQTMGTYRTGAGMDSDDDGHARNGNGIDIPISPTLPSSMNPRGASGGSLSIPQHVGQDGGASASSPRQRRRLNAGASPAGSNSSLPAGKAFSFQPTGQPTLPANAINHTGQSSYSLSADADLSPGGEVEDGQGMTELADVVGQLSLNENAEVRSSGLYLISKSARYKDFFWQFPSAGVWPPTDGRVLKTENEILQLTDAEDPLPDRQTQQHLLDLYWCYVHPHFPILYKISFMRQYRHSMSNPNSTEPSTPAGSGKVPMVLLLSMFALASRYSDLDPPRSDGKYWTAGQEYLDKAKRILNYDYGSSKLVSVQALLLMAYREIGTGAMSASWLFTGMAIRMAQDLGLFRDVEKWFLPVQRFSHEEKQTRKRVWWGCIILDRYTASYIGRPGTIHERDYDTSFPSEDEPDEHEQWKPLRPDGSEWTSAPKPDSDQPRAMPLARYPPTKSHTLSCFNAAGALAVIINRIIGNIYAIRVRVLGQSSETLLSLLDQSLASWYLALPPHLSYNPASKKVPPPHVLSLHLQFYSALILLHRPFIPGQNSETSPTHFPSHSICTTSANAIANIVSTFTKTFTLRQCPPFLTYPIFSAAVICVYNAGFDEALARPAKQYLSQCMNALKEMELIWGSALRQYELLHGLVDLRDAELSAELLGMNDGDATRGTKRPAESNGSGAVTPVSFDDLRPANFHARSLGGAGQPPASRRRSSTTASASTSDALSPAMANQTDSSMFGSPMYQPIPVPGYEGGHQSYDIINHPDPLSQFQAPQSDLEGLLNGFLPQIEAAGGLAREQSMAGGADTFQNSAFFGMPLSAVGEQWFDYASGAFGQQDSPESGGSAV
ncbi:hypothetical protein RQP46_003848 [Phenoliferia psychrophenolica]